MNNDISKALMNRQKMPKRNAWKKAPAIKPVEKVTNAPTSNVPNVL